MILFGQGLSGIKPFISGLPLLIRPLTAICLACKQELVFGFHLMPPFPHTTSTPLAAAYGKVIETFKLLSGAIHVASEEFFIRLTIDFFF